MIKISFILLLVPFTMFAMTQEKREDYIEKQSRIMGIPHQRFEGLTDNTLRFFNKLHKEESCDKNFVKKFLSQYPFDINECSKERDLSPLIMAIYRLNIFVVEQLLDHGANMFGPFTFYNGTSGLTARELCKKQLLILDTDDEHREADKFFNDPQLIKDAIAEYTMPAGGNMNESGHCVGIIGEQLKIYQLLDNKEQEFFVKNNGLEIIKQVYS